MTERCGGTCDEPKHVVVRGTTKLCPGCQDCKPYVIFPAEYQRSYHDDPDRWWWEADHD